MIWEKIQGQLEAATAPKYRIHRLLGFGGMAGVYLAEQPRLGRFVAIKVISPYLLADPQSVERFLNEARTVAKLSHPHIVTIHEIGESDGLHYFAMSFIPGASLGQIMDEAGSTLPIDVIKVWLAHVGTALDYAHRRGVVHRDIKPNNIILDAEGNAQVTDFGIAKVADQPGLTKTGMLVGTPYYMSPEQCSGEPATGRSDQYSLGTVAYHMITGHPPFEGPTMGVLASHLRDTPAPILSRRQDCPPELAAVIERMLLKDPQKRWPSIGEALATLSIANPDLDIGLRTRMARLANASGNLELDSDGGEAAAATPVPTGTEEVSGRPSGSVEVTADRGAPLQTGPIDGPEARPEDSPEPVEPAEAEASGAREPESEPPSPAPPAEEEAREREAPPRQPPPSMPIPPRAATIAAPLLTLGTEGAPEVEDRGPVEREEAPSSDSGVVAESVRPPAADPPDSAATADPPTPASAGPPASAPAVTPIPDAGAAPLSDVPAAVGPPPPPTAPVSRSRAAADTPGAPAARGSGAVAPSRRPLPSEGGTARKRRPPVLLIGGGVILAAAVTAGLIFLPGRPSSEGGPEAGRPEAGGLSAAGANPSQAPGSPPVSAGTPGTVRVGGDLPQGFRILARREGGEAITADRPELELPPGSYDLELSAPGFQTASTSLVVASGEERSWTPGLVPLADASSSQAGAPAEGRVRLRGELPPGFRVTVRGEGGVRTFTTPSFTLAPGSYEVQVEASGHDSRSTRLEVPAGGEASWTPALEASTPEPAPSTSGTAPARGSIRIEGELPGGSVVRVRGGEVDQVVQGGEILLERGSYDLEFTAPGYRTQTTSLAVTAGGSQAWQPELIREPPEDLDSRLTAELERFATALESRDMGRVRSEYPEVAPAIEGVLGPMVENRQNVRDLSVSVGSLTRVEVTADHAVVDVPFLLSFRDPRNAPGQGELRFRARFDESQGRWVLSGLQQQRQRP